MRHPLSAGDPCPTCGRPLAVHSVSGAILRCAGNHLTGTRKQCDEPGCTRLARVFCWTAGIGNRAYCRDHERI